MAWKKYYYSLYHNYLAVFQAQTPTEMSQLPLGLLLIPVLTDNSRYANFIYLKQTCHLFWIHFLFVRKRADTNVS